MISERKELATLSDDELISRLQLLSRSERHTTLRIILHLVEVDRRRAHLARGYFSLFEYCTQGLGYSESAAGRRIRTARCVRHFPEVHDLLRDGELTLTVVSRIANALTLENKDWLLPAVSNKSRIEVEKVLAQLEPARVIRDRVTPVRVPRRSDDSESQDPDLPPELEPTLTDGRAESSSAAVMLPTETPRWQDSYRRGEGEYDPTTAPAFKVEFAASEAFMKQFEEVKALLSSRFPGGANFEEVFAAVMGEFVERHSPAKREARRRKKEVSKIKRARDENESGKRTSAPREPGKAGGSDHPTVVKNRSRHIPASVKDAVFTRDEGRCTYVSASGRRCKARHLLQIDHIEPFARGGTSSPKNLRLLCAQHNRLEAERVYGRSRMRRSVRRE